jgi:hypothetical protein
MYVRVPVAQLLLVSAENTRLGAAGATVLTLMSGLV